MGKKLYELFESFESDCMYDDWYYHRRRLLVRESYDEVCRIKRAFEKRCDDEKVSFLINEIDLSEFDVVLEYADNMPKNPIWNVVWNVQRAMIENVEKLSFDEEVCVYRDYGIKKDNDTAVRKNRRRIEMYIQTSSSEEATKAMYQYIKNNVDVPAGTPMDPEDSIFDI